MGFDMWTENDEQGVSFQTSKPACCRGDRLHREIDALGIAVPYRIEWEEDALAIHFESPLSDAGRSAVEEAISHHDASDEELLSEEQKKDQIIEEARAKRLAGKSLDLNELSAVVDRLLFEVG